MTTTVRETKRGAQIAAIHAFADWLADNPAIPMPNLNVSRHLSNGDGTEAENLAAVRSFANYLGVELDEYLDDRTVMRYRLSEHLGYELFAWHKAGRNACDELERLRAEVQRLRAERTVDTDANQLGLLYTRADDEGDDPTDGLALTDRAREVLAVAPVSPARVPMHIGVVDDAEAVPVVRHFSFGHGHTDPVTGEFLRDKYVTVIAPDAEACRAAMLASKHGREWSLEYVPGTPRADEWIPRWTEHDRIDAMPKVDA